mmetsp:Transcript_24050/g.40892  ORF Transcript_24050/g.40892 Transcript_24050/m.40892 type:complete len:101 (+) Transcript_24050:318-620(+)
MHYVTVEERLNGKPVFLDSDDVATPADCKLHPQISSSGSLSWKYTGLEEESECESVHPPTSISVSGSVSELERGFPPASASFDLSVRTLQQVYNTQQCNN